MMRIRFLLLVAALGLVAAACTGQETGGDDAVASSETGSDTTAPSTTAAPERSYAGVDPAPEFPAGLDWLNTPGELTLGDLEGKIVLLDFWTYGCINCIHIIPDLKRLEAEYPDELVVVGVHSAKFTNESATENIRQVILRYGLEHPVVNDRDFEVWNTWGANAWPTIVLIDPAGNIVGGFAGEGVYVRTQPVIESLVAEFADTIDRSPLPVALERDRAPRTILSFPGKVLADPEARRLFIADSGHHRIVAADLDTGEVTAVYGDGRPGFRDGKALEARFNGPHGLALSPDGNVLYVADTNNHTVRSIDLESGQVGILAGTGQIGWPPEPGLAPSVRLNSPWDLVAWDQELYIANAGTHQIWVMDLASGAVRPVVGSAAEGVLNGPLAEAELAQPSGLAFDDAGRLYFADSESSAVRWADVHLDDGMTGVAAGTDNGLFDFGDRDGVGTDARFQHPLAVAFDAARARLVVADTYNSKLKTVDLATGNAATWLGDNQGWADGTDPRFYEPGGLSIAEGFVWVADTNNHAIRKVDLVTGDTSTLVLKGIEAFAPPPDASDYRGTVVTLDPVEVAAGPATIRLDIRLPDGYKVNEDAPSSAAWSASGGVARFAESELSLTGVEFPVEIPVELAQGAGTVIGDLTVIYCRDEAESLCFIEQLRFEVPVGVGPAGPSSTIGLPYEIAVPGDL